MEWMILPFRRYADFKGRSRRREFWMFQLLNLLVAFALVGPASLVAPSTRNTQVQTAEGAFSASANFDVDFTGDPVSAGLVAIWGLYALAALIPSLAVGVRRFHDRGASGWWYVMLMILSVIPLLGVIPATVLFVLMLLPGADGANRFGPDPKNPFGEDLFA